MSIRDDFFNAQAKAALWDVSVSLQRGNPLPLDANSVFESYEDLTEYVAGKIAYPGQIVAVVEKAQTKIYYLDQNLAICSIGGGDFDPNQIIELYGGSATDNITLTEEDVINGIFQTN